MYQSVNKSEFTSAFYNIGRGDNFSHKGLQALFDYLEQYEEETDTRIELDVIALCCDYSESDFETIKKDYSNLEIETIDDLREHTQVIMVDDESDENPTIIYQQF